MGQAWDKDLSAEHSKLFSDRCRGISTRRSIVETHLCDRKMRFSTYETHDESEVRTSRYSIRIRSQKADIGRT